MRHRVAGRHLGRPTDHRLAMYRNLVTDLVTHERITTTEAKAKEIRPMAEKMVTLARRGDLHARRQAMRFILREAAVRHLFDDIGPRMKDRPGGYLRITKLEPRKGDGAKMAVIEFVDYGGRVVAMPRPQRVTAAPTLARAAVPATAPAAFAEDEPVDAEVGQTEVTPENAPISEQTPEAVGIVDEAQVAGMEPAGEAEIEAEESAAEADDAPAAESDEPEEEAPKEA